MDPQHRLLLEVTQDALDDAGAQAFAHPDEVGVYVGMSSDEYRLLTLVGGATADHYFTLGTPRFFAANRISHCFGFGGPSLVLDAGCASSLAALDCAAQSLSLGIVRTAVVGAVNLVFIGDTGRGMRDTGLLSPSGRCAPLDASADGFVRGEGVGVIVVKRLRDVSSYDRVYAVVRSITVSHNGTNDWITAPSLTAQKRLARNGLERAGVEPSEVAYAELHAAALPAGDRIEARALGSVLRRGRQPERPCRVGSVKGNLGSLEAAAGMASLIKVALCLWRRSWVPTATLETVDAELGLEQLAMVPQLVLERHPDEAASAIATVSALALGGANAFAVLQAADPCDEDEEDAQRVPPAPEVTGHDLLLLSARDEPTLLEQIGRYRQLFLGVSPRRFRNVCFSSRQLRKVWERRVAIAGNSCEAMISVLEALLRGETPAGAFYDPTQALAEHARLAVLHGAQATNTRLPGYPFRREELPLEGGVRPSGGEFVEQSSVRNGTPPHEEAAHYAPDQLDELVCAAFLEATKRGSNEPLDLQRSFAAHGLSSLQSLTFRDNLSRACGVELNPSFQLEFGSLAALIEHVRLRGTAPAAAEYPHGAR